MSGNGVYLLYVMSGNGVYLLYTCMLCRVMVFIYYIHVCYVG